MSDSGGAEAREEPRRARQPPHARPKHRPHNKVQTQHDYLFFSPLAYKYPLVNINFLLSNLILKLITTNIAVTVAVAGWGRTGGHQVRHQTADAAIP